MKRDRGTDLMVGLIAAAAFLLMVFLLRMNVLLAGVLGGAVYLGLRLVMSGAAPPAPPVVSEQELLRSISQHAIAVSNLPVRRKLEGICQQAQRFLAFLEQHPDEAAAWRSIVRECLESTLRIIERYVQLARFADEGDAHLLAEAETLLDQVAGTFANLRHRLVEEGAADLSAEVEAFRGTLQAVDEVSLSSRRGGTS